MTPTKAIHRTPSSEVELSLLRAADAVLRRDGLSGVTVRAVAAEAGVAPMGVYNRFGSKHGLVDALLIRTIELFRVFVGGDFEQDPAERLRASALRYREWALANPAHYEAIFIARKGLGSAEVATHTINAFGQLTGRVEYAISGGVLRDGDLTEIAQQIWSMVHGAVALELYGLVLSRDPEQNYRDLLDTMIQGLAP